MFQQSYSPTLFFVIIHAICRECFTSLLVSSSLTVITLNVLIELELFLVPDPMNETRESRVGHHF